MVRFVLVRTTHPGNIGATARAMKNMGFHELYLVAPHHYPHQEAVARSSGAEDVLEQAKVVTTLEEALVDCHLVVGTSSRERALTIPLLTPREFANQTQTALIENKKIAVLFGQERTGLTNEELDHCHYQLLIPCNPQFCSLNIASAVQIIAYELHLKLANLVVATDPCASNWVTADEMEKFYEHLKITLIELEFLKPSNPKQLMRKLRRFFNRAQIEPSELNIFRGILSSCQKK